MYYSKIKKLIFPFVIVLVFILFPANNIFADTIDSGKCGDNLTWTLSEDGKLIIHGSGAMTNWKSVGESPWYDYSSYIKSIVIESGATTIGSYSFIDCKYLISVSIPETVTEIGRAAFCSCDNLTSIIIPNSVTYLGDSAFSYCSSLSDISLSENLSKIEYSCFFCCTSLTHITIPNGVEELGNYCFRLCSNLENVDIPESVISIQSGAFTGCSSLNQVIIPYSVTSIGYYAFSGCSSLKSVVLNRAAYNKDAFPSLSLNIFHYYFNISYINDEHGTISGKTRAYGTEYVEFTITSDNHYIIDSVFIVYNDEYIKIKLDENGNYTMPDVWEDFSICITFKSDGRFGTCGDDLIWTLDDGVLLISGEGAMYDWNRGSEVPWHLFVKEIKEVRFSGNVSHIGSFAFNTCSNISDFIIPETVKTIGDFSFQGVHITNILIPVSTRLSKASFYGCLQLSSVVIDKNSYLEEAFNFPDTIHFHYYYNISYINDGHGTISGNAISYGTDIVAFEVVPNKDYVIDKIVWSDNNTTGELIPDDNGKYTMPDSDKDVVIKASFKPIPPLSIICQPIDSNKFIGDNATFHIKAEGESILYQWQVYKNGTWKNTSLPGATDDTLSVEVLESRDGMKFRCVIKDIKGNKIVSNEVTLTVNSIVISSQPEDYDGPIGDNAKLSIAAEGNNLNYQWQVYKSGVWKNTSLPGNKTTTLEVGIIESRDGMKFRCVVTDGNGKSVTSDEVTLTVAVPAVAINSDPEDYSGPVGETALFTVMAEGEELTYQWQVYKSGAWKNTSLAGNRSSTLEVGILESRNGMKFRCVVKDVNGKSVTSNEAVLTVAAKAVSIISEPEDYSGPVGDIATFEIEAEGENLSYQWQVYKNGAWKNTSLPDNTTAKLDVEITEARDGMTFRCVVTDGNGKKATSDEVKIIVTAECSLQIVSEPESYTGSVGDTAMFEVVAEGENLTYQWQVYKNGAWKNTSLAGNNTSSLAVEVTTARNGMTFRCVVTDANGFSVVSDEVKVFVV